METQDSELTQEPKNRPKRNQLIAFLVMLAIGAAIFAVIQNVNGNHSYGQAKAECRALMAERAIGLNTISWAVNTGGVPDRVKEDDGIYLVNVVISDAWGNEETMSCMASYRSGNWETFVF